MQTEKKVEETRRSFLKKTLYRTPMLYCLGSMTLTDVLHADGTGGPAGPPGGGSPYGKRTGKHKTKKRKTLRF